MYINVQNNLQFYRRVCLKKKTFKTFTNNNLTILGSANGFIIIPGSKSALEAIKYGAIKLI